ncbi:MAG: thiamine pyrophosphate-dependent enzyme, partial [Sandaracinaceae bacterium]
DAARRALRAARRPLILAGLDLLPAPGGPPPDGLAAFARAWSAPVLTTYKAKGVLPETDPRSLGAFGLSPKVDALLLPFVREADVVVLAGYDPIEVRSPWREPFGPDATVIALSGQADDHGVHRMDHLFVGSVEAGLAALADGLEPGPRDGGDVARLGAALADAVAPPAAWGPGALFATLAAAVPPDARWAVDTGAHRILLSQQLRCAWPRQLLQSSGLCTMGYALPVALGAKLAEPSRPVVAVVGDGGLEMVLGELATARDLRLPVLVVVVDDRSLALIEKKQRAMGLPSRGVDSGGTDFARVAEALGGVGVRCDDGAALTRGVREGLARTDTFTVLHCPVPRRAYDRAS